MKKIIFIAVFISICSITVAQTTVNPAAFAVLDKFVGTWVYNQDGKDVTIILKKVTKRVNQENNYIDVIEGYHIYNLDRKKIENSIERNEPSLTLGYIEDRNKPNNLKITYHDSGKNKTGNARLVYIPGDIPKLQLNLSNEEGVRVRVPGQPAFDRYFTLPHEMLLTKEN